VCRQGVNFTNILCTALSYESFTQSFFVLTFRFELFAQEYWRNCAYILLVKLTKAVNFTNILRAAFAANLKCNLRAKLPYEKAVRKMLVKLTKDHPDEVVVRPEHSETLQHDWTRWTGIGIHRTLLHRV
jgi:hypothetical protein